MTPREWNAVSIAKQRADGREGSRLHIMAPSHFHILERAGRMERFLGRVFVSYAREWMWRKVRD